MERLRGTSPSRDGIPFNALSLTKQEWQISPPSQPSSWTHCPTLLMLELGDAFWQSYSEPVTLSHSPLALLQATLLDMGT